MIYIFKISEKQYATPYLFDLEQHTETINVCQLLTTFRVFKMRYFAVDNRVLESEHIFSEVPCREEGLQT